MNTGGALLTLARDQPPGLPGRAEINMLLAALALLAMSQPVEDQQMTLGNLIDLCAAKEPGEACRFYTLGVMEGTSLASDMAKDKHFCVPVGTSQSTVTALVKRMALADVAFYPKDTDMPAVSFVGAVLVKNYPCH